MVLIVLLSLWVGCSNNPSEENPYSEFITIDVLSSKANYQGIQAGWFGKVVKEKFNMEINIIAPNVAGGGDTLFQTRSAAGNLGDIVMFGAENDRLIDSVNAGLLLDMTPYQDRMPHVMQYSKAIDMLLSASGDIEGLYAIPAEVTSYPPTEPSESVEPVYGPYLRWDLYTAIGAPTMNTLEDLLPVLKDMQKLEPTTSKGNKTYGFSLFKDWDGNLMMMGKQPSCFYGYDEIGFILAKADGSDFQNIVDSDSMYVRSLKLYFEANQLGLLDPESKTQNWDTVNKKYAEGQILYSPWPWLGQSAYNTAENLDAGRGFMIAPIDDMTIFSYGASPLGDNAVIAIGAKAQDPERMADFIDWLYSPEGIMMSTTETGNTCGPEGLTWSMVDGRPELTAFGIEALLEGEARMPVEWGGGLWSKGTSQLNFSTVLPKDINPHTGEPYEFRLWPSYLEHADNPVLASWQEHNNALSTFDYLKEHNQYIVAPGSDYLVTDESIELSTIRNQCRKVIVDTSWKMVYASDINEFNNQLSTMQTTLKSLNYDKVLTFDLEKAKEQDQARKDTLRND